MPTAKTKSTQKEINGATKVQVSNLAQALHTLEELVQVLAAQTMQQHENIVALSDQLDALKQPETN